VKAEDEDFMNSRAAAKHVGYEPGADADGRPLPTDKDKAMRAFYEFARRAGIEKHYRGRGRNRRLLFLRRDLDRAISRDTDAQHQSRFERMETLAREHARGEVRPS
jgi:hypothetical protein